MINTHWLELPLSRTNFHGPKGVRAIEVRVYFNCIKLANHGYFAMPKLYEKRTAALIDKIWNGYFKDTADNPNLTIPVPLLAYWSEYLRKNLPLGRDWVVLTSAQTCRIYLHFYELHSKEKELYRKRRNKNAFYSLEKRLKQACFSDT